MLMVVKNQLRVCLLSLKYNIMREMLNKVTFLTNIGFMMLNNAAFIVQWIILLRLKTDIGGYTWAGTDFFCKSIRIAGTDNQWQTGFVFGRAQKCAA